MQADLERIWPNATVECVVTRLCELDPEGEAIRYPVNTKRQGQAPTLDKDVRHLDLGALVADVVEVVGLLEGADTGGSTCTWRRNDMLAEQCQIEFERRAEYGAEM